MENIISQLQEIIATYAPRLSEISEADFSAKAHPAKWSKKEILGHLIDSAQNNIRRFIVAQYQDCPIVAYAQDSWVSISGYKNYNTADLITLWVLLNKHAAIILKNMDPVIAERLCNVGEMRSIKWLAADYNKHTLHHLHALLGLEPVVYP